MTEKPADLTQLTPAAPAASLWRHLEFRKLWLGQTISEFGSWLGALSLLAILFLDATPAQMGLLETLRAVPALLIGLFAGVWVDRLRRRPLLIAADLGRGLLLGLVALIALGGSLRIELLYLVALLVGSLTTLFGVAVHAYVPQLVSRQRLVEANSKLGATESLAEISSPGLGGLLVQLLGAPVTLLLDAVSYLVSALFLGRIRTRESKPSPSAQTMRQDIAAGLRHVRRHPLLRPLAAASAWRSFFGGFFAALYSLFVIREVGLTPAVLGLLIGSGGIGAFLAALTIGRLTARFDLGPLLIASLFFSGLLALLVPLASAVPAIAAAQLMISQLLGDFGLAIFFITSLSLRQAVTPDLILGRVGATFEFLAGAAGTTGILTGGLLGQWAGLRPTIAVAAAGMFFAFLWLLISPVRRLEQAPLPTTEDF